MNKKLLTLIFAGTFCVNAVAGGTNTSSTTFTTIGNSNTTFDSNSISTIDGAGISVIGNFIDAENYNTRTETYDNNSKTETFDSGYTESNYTDSGVIANAGVLTKTIGTRSGTSLTEGTSRKVVDSSILGGYEVIAYLDGELTNQETGDFEVTKYSNSDTNFHTTTDYEAVYSNTETNY